MSQVTTRGPFHESQNTLVDWCAELNFLLIVNRVYEWVVLYVRGQRVPILVSKFGGLSMCDGCP